MEASLDPHHAAIVNTPPLLREVDPPPPRWMQCGLAFQGALAEFG
jgi:hypothetical protein